MARESVWGYAMNLFSSQLLMWRGSSDEQDDGGEGCDVWSALPEAGVELLEVPDTSIALSGHCGHAMRRPA